MAGVLELYLGIPRRQEGEHALTAIGVVLGLPLLCASVQRAAAEPLQIDQYIELILEQGEVPGLSVAIAKNGRVLWERGFGWADVENGVRATESTPFSVASVTKAITATAVMQLQERSQLRLDGSVNDYLGSKLHSPMWDARKATIRQLLSHTSGLTTFSRWCYPGEPGCEVEKEIRRYGILVWPPGEVFDYSNLGYGILGHLIERVSGGTLNSYLRKSLFTPLNMRHCGMKVRKGSAAQYHQKTHRRLEVKISGHPAASGLFCSAHDLLLFAMFHLKDGLTARSPLRPAAIDETHRAQSNTHGGYGLGWWIKQESDRSVILAQGGTTGSYASVMLIPSEDLAVVVLANSYSKSVSELGDQIVARLLPGFGSGESGRPVEQGLKDTAASSSLVGNWSGQITTVKGPVPASLKISSDGSARGQIGSQPSAPIEGVSIKPRHFYGQLRGDPSIPGAPADAYTLELDMALHGNDLIGAATTRPPAGDDGNQLPHWIRLSRLP